MKYRLKQAVFPAVCLLAALGMIFTGCDIGGDDGPSFVAVSGAVLNTTATTILAGGGETLFVTVSPPSATNQNVSWSSSNQGVATVSAGGVVNALAAGTAIITVTTADGNKTSACTVTVSVPVTVSGVTVNPATVNVVTGGTQTFTAEVAGTGSPAQSVTWTVSGNNSPGTTITTGGILRVAAGETAASLTVTATSTVDPSKSGTAAVTIVFDFSTLSCRDMVQAAFAAIAITGNSAYYYSSSSSDQFKGVFIENRTVILNPFYIAKYETTYELWYTVRQWAADKGYTFDNAGCEGSDGTEGAAPTAAAKYEPVTGITWGDAVVWCNAYSEMSGKAPVYTYGGTVVRDARNKTACNSAVIDRTKNGYRLPTEAEWEYAARGGGTPSPSGVFAWKWAGTGSESSLVYHAWYYDNSSSTTHPAGEKTANWLSLHDMSGNVWELCWDRYGSVDTGESTDPEGPASGTSRVMRGGGYFHVSSSCAVAARGDVSLDSGYDDVGFRVVCSQVP